MTPEQFKQALADQQVNLSDQQAQQFADYFQLLVAYNQKVNLTTITAVNDVYLKHFYDSITPLFFISKLRTGQSTLVDVGAGAGFPSIPMKIMNPKLKVTIVDSLQKRLTFLAQLLESLGIDDVQLVHARAEDFGGRTGAGRERFDFATARALARLSVMSELCLPLVKPAGQLIALKGAHAQQELADATTALQLLGGAVANDFSFSLPKTNEQRHIIVIDKVKKTPVKYPRQAGIPAKQALS
ncbi:16S rRNA (guanine(527)-N(7))-methyltransferase RsmG [Fructilactobacillus florum]|uniref:16S rRNA (guanine(527)-N(7))-methyltransferase RsmG n=1 Tax=Fructilactobacillus florum TaxID=640331 RepID=UPI00028E4D67|nr:16S rRNA (guanine(527)-N(7))-methyltransferase RsmG [Fructilactobacillus florum]EKK20442.1 rRNA small subunit methyltransferase, glucose inhibited division protein GidB [Fructilactobacillus florum 2F]